MVSVEKNTDAIAQINNTMKEQKEYILERINCNELNLFALKEIQEENKLFVCMDLHVPRK